MSKSAESNLLNKGRLYSLDVLRIAATLAIIFHHYQQATNIKYSNGINYYYGRFYFGYTVEFFLVLSGLLAARNTQLICDCSFLTYFKKKYLRLVPVVAISIVAYHIIVIVSEGFNAGTGRKIHSITEVLISALCLHDGCKLKNFGINYPMWYIGVLIVCFVVLYIVSWACNRLNINASYGFAIVIITGIVIKITGLDLPFLNEDMARGYMAFFTGSLLAQIYTNQREIKKWQSVTSLIVLILVLLIVVYEKFFDIDEIQFVLIFLFYPALITLFVSPDLIRIFDRKFIGQIGRITFDVYVWHDCLNLIVSILLTKIDVNVPESRILMWIFALACFVVGTASYYWIEVPLRRLVIKD